MLGTVLAEQGVAWFKSHYGDAVPADDRPVSVLANANYDAVRDNLCCENIHFIRNPLSIVSSAYYSHLRTHSTDGWERLERQRELLQSREADEGVYLTLNFLESIQFYPRTPGPLASLLNWDYDDPRVRTVRMEDVVNEPDRFLTDVFQSAGLEAGQVPDVSPFRFEQFTGRQIGQVDPESHYRSGDPQGWRKELPAGAIAYIRTKFRHVLERYYPSALVD